VTVPALYTKHRPQARKIAHTFWIPGIERQDVEQEADIGLWIAARKWDPEGGASFKSFAELVIRRRLSTLLSASLREGRDPKNEAPRYLVNGDGEEVAIVDTLPGGLDPYEVNVTRELFERLCAAARSLTPLERTALERVANGDSYTAGGKKDKQMDNAITRMRAKLRAPIEEEEE
jgi:RNA polymerase sporulation-specific sigma factor